MSNHRLRYSVLVVCAAFTQPVFASGYNFGTQSVSTQGTANASTAEAADASTLYYNAAGLSYLEGTQATAALNLLFPSIKYSNGKGSTLNGTPIQGQDSGTITKSVVAVPHMYVSRKLDDKWAVGFGVYVPFGSQSEYQRDSRLRYNVNATTLKVIDLNPAFAYRFSPTFSIGGGVFAQHADAELRQYANFAATLARYYQTVAQTASVPALQRAAAAQAARAAIALDGAVDQLDGYADVSGEDWGYGFHFGLLWDVSPSTRVGFNYRSKVDHELEGDGQWNLATSAAAKQLDPTAVIGSVFGYVTSDTKIKITTPESASFQLMHALNDRTKLFGDATWTRHSRFDIADIEWAKGKTTINSAVPATITRLTPMWTNSWKIGVGASYQYTDPFQLRFGLAYDQSPTPDEEHRLSTLPDNDRIWFSFGGKYALSKSTSLNFAYTYIRIKDSSVKLNGYCGGSSPAINPAGAVNCVSSYTTASADYKNSAQLLGLQFNHQF